MYKIISILIVIIMMTVNVAYSDDYYAVADTNRWTSITAKYYPSREESCNEWVGYKQSQYGLTLCPELSGMRPNNECYVVGFTITNGNCVNMYDHVSHVGQWRKQITCADGEYWNTETQQCEENTCEAGIKHYYNMGPQAFTSNYSPVENIAGCEAEYTDVPRCYFAIDGESMICVYEYTTTGNPGTGNTIGAGSLTPPEQQPEPQPEVTTSSNTTQPEVQPDTPETGDTTTTQTTNNLSNTKTKTVTSTNTTITGTVTNNGTQTTTTTVTTVYSDGTTKVTKSTQTTKTNGTGTTTNVNRSTGGSSTINNTGTTTTSESTTETTTDPNGNTTTTTTGTGTGTGEGEGEGTNPGQPEYKDDGYDAFIEGMGTLETGIDQPNTPSLSIGSGVCQGIPYNLGRYGSGEFRSHCAVYDSAIRPTFEWMIYILTAIYLFHLFIDSTRQGGV